MRGNIDADANMTTDQRRTTTAQLLLIAVGLLLASGCATTSAPSPADVAAQRYARHAAALPTVQPGMPERRVREVMGAPDSMQVAYKPHDRTAAVRDGFAYVYFVSASNAVAKTGTPPARATIWFSNERTVTRIEMK
jgi:hypothetical protein